MSRRVVSAREQVEMLSPWRTAGPKRQFTQDWQQVGFDLMPVDAVAHYMHRKETGFGDEKAERHEQAGQLPLSEQIKQRGYEKPVHLVTDGKSGSIYDGHHRIDIARQLGHTHIPVEVSWRTLHPDYPDGSYDNKIEPWLKGWLTDMRRGRETVGKRAATTLYRGMGLSFANDPERVHYPRFRDLYRHYRENPNDPMIGDALAEYFEQQHRWPGTSWGRHWTTDRDVAENFAHCNGGMFNTVATAEWDGQGEDETGFGRGGDYPHESEVTLHPGTGLHLTDFEIANSPLMDGGWNSVLREPRHIRAGVQRQAERVDDFEWQRSFDGGGDWILVTRTPDGNPVTVATSPIRGQRSLGSVLVAADKTPEQHLRDTYEPYPPGAPDLPDSLKPHLMLPTDIAHHYREYDRPNDENTQMLKRVIADQGIRQPLKISTDGTHALMIEGNHRLNVARQLGITHVPVQVFMERPGEVMVNSRNSQPVPLESHLGQWVDQNRQHLKSFWS